ncbi:MAG TPA: TIGR01777 family oxidoreductase [Oligoflexia bacterium]|nr:TIGR01777 family oxidoreductase [Oligoflexia bacterium]HMR25704.1 TIGR01777 family oxidoreductase [Oligoflexia bacterium]
MNILITGATGFIGQKISLQLIKDQHNLIVIGRSSEKQFRQVFTFPCKYYSWEKLNTLQDDLNIDAVIHLAGASIAGGRWTHKRKKIILDSRVKTAKALFSYFNRINIYPKTFLSASAIGYYNFSQNEVFDEDSPKGDGFLADVCKQWEDASLDFEKNSRRILLRFGLVFDPRDGFLKKMGPLFSTGLAGRIGPGKQWMSWVHIDDLVKAVLFCLKNNTIHGPVNVVSPQACSNVEFTQTLSQTLKQTPFIPVPALALKLILGEMAVLALGSQHVTPKKLSDHHFTFDYPDLKAALKELYAWHTLPYQQIFSDTQWFNHTVDKIFPFFCEAKNLEKITPPLLKFRVLNQSTQSIEPGTLINYKLKIHGIPTKWTTLIKAWQKNTMFIDTQKKGPYKEWQHTHTFQSYPNGTLMLDDVIYRVPMGRLGLIMTGAWVLKDIITIFKYRKIATQNHLR